MKFYDAVVIGGGVLGCFVARNLCRWSLSVALVEAEEDVCSGITRANSAIVYAGYDNKPGSLKAAMTVAGNAGFHRLCDDLEVPFSRCGSLMVSTGELGERVLHKKFANGLQTGVSGLQLISGEEAWEMEKAAYADINGSDNKTVEQNKTPTTNNKPKNETPAKTGFTGTTYKEAVAYVKANGGDGSGIIDQAKWQRQKNNNEKIAAVQNYDTYQEYLKDITEYLLQ